MASRSVDLVILRHGEAEPYAGSDAQRELTEAGRLETEQQVQVLSELGFAPDEIIHSPFTRTCQTADICHAMFPNAQMKSHSGLMHSADVNQIPYLLNQQGSVLFVSHMPLVARIVNFFCPETSVYGFGVSGFARMTIDLSDYSGTITHDATRGIHGSI